MNTLAQYRASAWRPMLILLPLLCLIAGTARAGAADPERAVEKIERGALVIDVRSAAEVRKTGLLADAKRVRHTNTQGLIEAIGPDLDRPVVLYCASGFRSGIAVGDLKAAGYTNLLNGGGFDELAAALEES